MGAHTLTFIQHVKALIHLTPQFQTTHDKSLTPQISVLTLTCTACMETFCTLLLAGGAILWLHGCC